MTNWTMLLYALALILGITSDCATAAESEEDHLATDSTIMPMYSVRFGLTPLFPDFEL